MKPYLVFSQLAIPFGPPRSNNFFIQFRAVGEVQAHTATHALRLAKALGWRAIATARRGPADPALPPLTAVRKIDRQHHALEADAPPLPTRYLRMQRGDWK